MGTLVSSTREKGKISLTVQTVAAASVAIGAGEAGIFIGNSARTLRTTGFTRLQQCIDRARETGFKTAAAKQATRTPVTGAKLSVAVSSGAALPTIAETDVAVLWDQSFVPTGSQSRTFIFNAHLERCVERALEALANV